MLGTLVVIASHEGTLTDAAHVVLPATSWAEHNGTYVNRQGFHQASDKGLFPQGDSKPAWELARQLGSALGLEVSWAKLKDVRSQLVPTAAPAAAPATAAASTGAP
jgi:NADH-quinone oxidoreductase subunit G